MPDKPPFMNLMRELVRCYQAFESYSLLDIRATGLTPPQFDVIATLGNTAGMTFRELGEKTLITKGTLTGIVDRLTAKGLVRREDHPGDARCFKVVLTPAGEAEFRRVFQPHVHYLEDAFRRLPRERQIALTEGLESLRQAFELSKRATSSPKEAP
ncbi:MAG: MarR family transcriptional regulator [Betaproteobacteria bacterium]|nr:MarR family transcriptional regulator [Betaproteobacteria bacterium]